MKTRAILAVAAFAALWLAAAPPAPWLAVPQQTGLTAAIPNGGDRAKKFIIETTGSGVALFDFDRDGLLDVFLVSGEGSPSRLYKNLGGLRFAEITAAAGLTRAGWGQGVCTADLNRDGFTDLLVTYWGGLTLYRNEGGKRLTDITRQAGLTQQGQRYNTGCVFVDYDRDGDADLFVANYLDFSFESTPPPGANPYCYYRGLAVNCGPRGLPFSRNLLYRNNGDGTFTDVSAESGIAAPDRSYCLGAVATDADNDGWLDLYVACDQTPSILYINQRDGTFKDEALLRGVALDENGRAMSGMGVAAADYDNDGDIDLFRTNFSDERVTLYRNHGDGNFDESTIAAGLGVNTRNVGWGCAFADFDHDGWKDLIQVNGHVFPEVDRLGISIRYRQRPHLYRNVAGRFEEIAGPDEVHSARGLAIGDLDNNGTLEVLVNNQNEPPSLWRMAAKPTGNWLMVDAPAGSRVTIEAGGRRQVAEAQASGSYLSVSDGRVHFGLGPHARVDRVSVRFPDGAAEQWRNVTANRVITARR